MVEYRSANTETMGLNLVESSKFLRIMSLTFLSDSVFTSLRSLVSWLTGYFLKIAKINSQQEKQICPNDKK